MLLLGRILPRSYSRSFPSYDPLLRFPQLWTLIRELCRFASLINPENRCWKRTFQFVILASVLSAFSPRCFIWNAARWSLERKPNTSQRLLLSQLCKMVLRIAHMPMLTFYIKGSGMSLFYLHHRAAEFSILIGWIVFFNSSSRCTCSNMLLLWENRQHPSAISLILLLEQHFLSCFTPHISYLLIHTSLLQAYLTTRERT